MLSASDLGSVPFYQFHQFIPLDGVVPFKDAHYLVARSRHDPEIVMASQTPVIDLKFSPRGG
jgi:hypothetical protein